MVPPNVADPPQTPTVIIISSPPTSIQMDSTVTLVAVNKADGKPVSATWTSSDENILIVDKTTGKLTPKKEGTAKITAQFGNSSDLCSIKVVENPSAFAYFDYLMSKQVLSLLNYWSYTEDFWGKIDDLKTKEEREALIERRKDILNKFHAEVMRVLGTSERVEIEFIKLGTGIGGQCVPYDRSPDGVTHIRINIDRLTVDGYYDRVFNYVIHETRHVYQWEAVDGIGNHYVSAETKEKWRYCWLEYYDGSKTNAIEWDAYNFANQISSIQGLKAQYAGSWPSER